MPDNITVNVHPAGRFCNITCGYCDLACRDSEVCKFDFDEFAAALATLAKTGHKSAFFVLHGGEPLCAEPAVLHRIIDICERYFFEARVQLQTNGTLLTEGLAKTLLERRCGFSLSLDPAMADSRYDSKMREVVKGNIKMLLRLGADVGVISVAHALNLDGYSSMMRELCEMGVSAWTINRIRGRCNDKYYISELDYVKLLLNILQEWIEQKLYESIRILPLLDLLTSKGGNHCCRYSNLPLKCRSFFTFDGRRMIGHCDHLLNPDRAIDEKCRGCIDYDFCGGGCPGERKEDSFCNARRLFKKVIQDLRIAHGERL